MTTTNLILAIILAIVSCLPSCGALGGDAGQRSLDRIEQAANRMDRNQDGILTNREIKGSGGDIGLWVGLGSALLGLFGVGKAAAATKAADLAQSHVDDLHDKVTEPAKKTA